MRTSLQHACLVMCSAVLAAQSSGAFAAPKTRPSLDQVVAAARIEAAQMAGRPAESFRLVSAERVTWPDGGLGCPRPGVLYTAALVPGFRVVLTDGSARFQFHADQRGSLQLCPPGQATDPVEGRSN